MNLKQTTTIALLLLVCASVSLIAQENPFDINKAVSALQIETDLADKNQTVGISDTLLDEIYLNWEIFDQQLKSQSAEAGLDFILPIYTNLNVLLQKEEGLTNPVPSERIIKMTAVLAHLFAGVLQASREYLTELDPESYTYQTRLQGLQQAQVGGVNMVLGSIITLYTAALPEDIYALLEKNLSVYGPAIMQEVDQQYREQLFAYLAQNIEAGVLPEQKDQYTTFLTQL